MIGRIPLPKQIHIPPVYRRICDLILPHARSREPLIWVAQAAAVRSRTAKGLAFPGD